VGPFIRADSQRHEDSLAEAIRGKCDRDNQYRAVRKSAQTLILLRIELQGERKGGGAGEGSHGDGRSKKGGVKGGTARVYLETLLLKYRSKGESVSTSQAYDSITCLKKKRMEPGKKKPMVLFRIGSNSLSKE